MRQFLSMFHEKDDPDRPWSMKRTVAWLFAVSWCIGFLMLAWRGVLPNWAMAAIGIATVLALPLQAFLSKRANMKATLEQLIAKIPGRNREEG